MIGILYLQDIGNRFQGDGCSIGPKQILPTLPIRSVDIVTTHWALNQPDELEKQKGNEQFLKTALKQICQYRSMKPFHLTGNSAWDIIFDVKNSTYEERMTQRKLAEELKKIHVQKKGCIKAFFGRVFCCH